MSIHIMDSVYQTQMWLFHATNHKGPIIMASVEVLKQ